MKFLLNYLEIILSMVGLLLIILIPMLFPSDYLWQTTAFVATLVGVLHGGIFWLVRRRQRMVRQDAILQIRHMMQDVIKNRLAVISLNTQLSRPDDRYRDKIMNATAAIELVLDHLSDESLRTWTEKYNFSLEKEQVDFRESTPTA